MAVREGFSERERKKKKGKSASGGGKGFVGYLGLLFKSFRLKP